MMKQTDHRGGWKDVSVSCRGRNCAGGRCRNCHGSGQMSVADADRQFGAGRYRGAPQRQSNVGHGANPWTSSAGYQRGQQYGQAMQSAGCMLPMVLLFKLWTIAQKVV